MGRKKEGVLVEFPWYDAFQSNKRAVSDSVAYEKASVLFNLAAVCSQQSLANDLTTDGGLKAAARHFQVSSTLHTGGSARANTSCVTSLCHVTPSDLHAMVQVQFLCPKFISGQTTAQHESAWPGTATQSQHACLNLPLRCASHRSSSYTDCIVSNQVHHDKLSTSID